MPTQNSPPAPVPTATEKKLLVKNEIEEILKKEVTAPAQSELEQFLGSIPVIPIILPKKSSRFRPVIDMNLYVEDNQKTLNSHLEYNYFKMEYLLLLNELLQKGIIFPRWIWKTIIFQYHFTETHKNFKRNIKYINFSS